MKEKVVSVLYKGGAAGRENKRILGCVENELGLRSFVESKGAEFVVTSSKDYPNSTLDKHLPDATVVISQPFWPAYITAERVAKAPNLKLAITAGVGSDHVDLAAACEKNITVAEVTGSNVVSVAEHVVMMILSLVRNYLPSHEIATSGGWDIAECASRAYDLEDKHVGTVAVGRIGHRVLKRLVPFDVHLHYFDPFKRLSPEDEKALNVTYHATLESMLAVCDVITINAPLHPMTENLFDSAMIAKCKKGVYIVNTARGKIVNAQAMADAVAAGHVAGYAGDVWFPQPPPKDHPWRTMQWNGMTPHYSGTTLDAQARYAAGTKEILENYFDGKPQRQEYLIVDAGKIVSPAYTKGNTTTGAK